MTAMTRTFRNRGSLPWWYWRAHADRLQRAGEAGPSYTAEALALFSRFTTPPADARKALINNRIVALKAAGVWAKLDCDYVLAAADEQGALLNWKQNLYNLTKFGTMPHVADRGSTGNGTTGYLATGFVPSTAGGNFSLNSAHLSVWSLTNAQQAGTIMGARTTSTTQQSFLSIRNASNLGAARLNAANSTSIAVASSSGSFVGRRSSSTATALFKNGASLGTNTENSTALPAVELVIGGLNTGGVVGSFNNYQIAMAGFGANLSDAEIAAMYSADLAYLQGVGAA